MPPKQYKPTSPGRRFGTVADFAEITKTKPEKSLLRPKHRTGGRNNRGRLTMRHQGGGAKQQYRIIDFKRDKTGVPGKAGRSRWRGLRPANRGGVMNPRDHPHGGGEGKSPIGPKTPMSPWGKPALGAKTRRNKATDKYIIRKRTK